MSRQCHIAIQAAALSLGTVGAVAVWTIEGLLEAPRVVAVSDTAECGALPSTDLPAHMRAIEEHCREVGGDRCDVASAIDRARAIREADAAFGGDARFDHASLRFDDGRAELVWSVRDLGQGTRVELDAFDGSVLEVSFADGSRD